MNFHNLREFGSCSQDSAFLANFSPNRDFLQELCKVESDLDHSELHIKHEGPDMQAEESPSSLKGDDKGQKQKGKSRDKKKVFYRDKMAELMKPGETIKVEYKYMTYNANQCKGPLSKEEQLKRNRESAKNSRQRKKEYVSYLQKINEENEKMITDLRYQLQQVTLERDRLKQVHQFEIKDFYKSKAEAYETLETILKQPDAPLNDVKNVIDDMMSKFGTAGSERVSVTNYYMNQIIEVLVSDIHKYFLNSSVFTLGSNPRNPKPIDVDIMRLLNLDASKLGAMVSKYKERFQKQTTVFKDLTQELYRIFKSIQNQGKVIQVVFAEMMKDLDVRCLGSMIVWFQENKFCRQIKRVRREWTDQLKKGQEEIDLLRKQVKQEDFQ